MPSDLTLISAARQLAETGHGKRLRESVRITVRELAEAIGVDAATLSRWEHGQSVPRAAAALRWVTALNELAANSVDDQ